MNGGVCGKFSTGDGATTFRVPLIAGMEIAAADAGHTSGDYQPDQMRAITGTLTRGGLNNYCIDRILANAEGAFYMIGGSCTAYPSATPYSSNALSIGLGIDSSRLGSHYSGEDTHSKRIFAVPLLKM